MTSITHQRLHVSCIFTAFICAVFFNSLCFLFPLSYFSCAFRLNVCYNCLFAHCLLPLACIFAFILLSSIKVNIVRQSS